MERARETPDQDELDDARTLVGGGMARGARELLDALELPGRVTLLKDDQLVIAIDVADFLGWLPPERVTLVFADGTEQSVRVDAKLSSAGAGVGAGQTLRLVLELGAPLATRPSSIALGEMYTRYGRAPIVINLDSR
jgi:hypothetical protein